jgi:hypothetical protein
MRSVASQARGQLQAQFHNSIYQVVYHFPCALATLARGANLAKPTTTQRALDRVYWEIRWMDLMAYELAG